MRKIVREITFTKVQVLESTADGNVVDLGMLTFEGGPDIKRIKKELSAAYPEQNVFYGTIESGTEKFEMTAAEFIEKAHVATAVKAE